MKKLIVMGAILMSSNLFAINFKQHVFRLKYYVFYEILYKAQGISPETFKDIEVTKEGSNILEFTHDGKEYKVRYLAMGAMYVDMPEGQKDRYLSRPKVPSIVLSQFD